METGISEISLRLGSPNKDLRCTSLTVGGSVIYLHGTLDEMRAFVDTVDVAVARAEAEEVQANGL